MLILWEYCFSVRLREHRTHRVPPPVRVAGRFGHCTAAAATTTTTTTGARGAAEVSPTAAAGAAASCEATASEAAYGRLKLRRTR